MTQYSIVNRVNRLRFPCVLYFFLLDSLPGCYTTGRIINKCAICRVMKGVFMNVAGLHTLRVVDVYKKFPQGEGHLEVLRGINTTFTQGASYAITGVSGSGKSTFLHIVAGLDKPTAGDVFFDTASLVRMHDKSLYFNTKIGFVFQFHYLIKELTVLENIALMGRIKGFSDADARTRGLELLELVGMSNKASEFPTKLSGGQLQRTAIARALFNRPAFLIADEPTGNLDEENVVNIVNLLLRFQQEWGMGLIICTHDKAVSCKMGTVLQVHQGVLNSVEKL